MPAPALATNIILPLLAHEPAMYLNDCTNDLTRQSFEYDANFFKLNPARRFNIRAGFMPEFSTITDVALFMRCPYQNVLVSSVTPTSFLCQLVYLGPKYMNLPIHSDSDVFQVLQRMRKDGGIDQGAIDSFMKRENIIVKSDAQTASGKNVN